MKYIEEADYQRRTQKLKNEDGGRQVESSQIEHNALIWIKFLVLKSNLPHILMRLGSGSDLELDGSKKIGSRSAKMDPG